MHKYFYLLIILFSPWLLKGQPTNNFWENYTSGYEVHDIAFEGDTVWVATRGGLTQIIQSTGTSYFYNASNSLLNSNYLNRVVVDQNHIKYVATDKGLFSFNGVQWKEFATGEVKYLEVDFNNTVWFLGKHPSTGLFGLIKFDGNNFTSITSSNSNVPSTDFKIITTDRNKNLWLLANYIVAKFDGTQWQLINNSNPNLGNYTGYWQFAVDENDGIWLANNDTINYFNNINWTPFNNSNSPLTGSYFYDITPDDSGNVYITSTNNFFKTDGTNWQIFDTTNCTAVQHSIYRCSVDQNQNVWVGTVNNCIYSYDFVTWKQYNTSKTIMHSNLVESLATGKNKMVGIHLNTGFVLKSDTSWYNFDYYSPGLHQREAVAVDTSNVFWACHYYLSNSGPIALIVDSLNWSVPSFNNDHCNDVSIDGFNNKWFATSDGIVKYDGTNWTRFNSSNSPIVDDYVMKIFVDKTNTVWISEPYGALQKFDGNTWVNVDLTQFGFPANFPNNFAEDLQGNVYVAAGWYGAAPPQQIGKFDGVSWTLLPNLPGTMVGSIKFDLFNNLWVTFLNQGLAKYDGNSWTLYTVENSGLPDLYGRDIDVDEFNNIWIGTVYGGVAVFNERELNFTNPVPKRFRVSGNFFFDTDANGIKSVNEPFLNNQKVIENASQMSAYSNLNGDYRLLLSEGIHTISPQLRPNWYITTDSLNYTVIVDSVPLSGYDFGINAPAVSDYDLNLYSGIHRCGFTIPFWINYTNTGTTLDSGFVDFTVDSSCTALSFLPQPNQIIGNTMRWNFSALNPFNSDMIKINVLYPLSPGDSVHHTSSIYYYDNGIPVLVKSGSIDDEIICSSDPNDKTVRPRGVTAQHLTLLDDTLNYIIRFQNVGNDTAFFVKIIDSLDINIDPASINIVSASHNYNWDFYNGKLYIDFPNCLLPDSATNMAGSCGYVHFKANVYNTTASYTTVTNKAKIIFDFNDAIVTNEVFNTMVDTIVGLNESETQTEWVSVVPNPMSKSTIITFLNPKHDLVKLKLYNLLGVEVVNKETTYSSFEILRDDMISGIYFVELSKRGKKILKKLVVQ